MMTIIDLLNSVGIENVKVQPLAPSLKSAVLNKRGETEITFYTRALTVNDLLYEAKNTVGMILWIPKGRLPTPELVDNDSPEARRKSKSENL